MDRISTHIESISSKRIRPSLEPFKQALEEAGLLPHKFKKFIIAGTNGKGSTAYSLYRLLRRSGIKVGLLTSPHLCEVRERVVINGKFSEKQWLDALKYYEPLIRKFSLTYYEVTVLLAYHFFSQMSVDVAVMEVGLGGRWDATNVGVNDYAIITGVALDHQEYLGNTLRSILHEKLQVVQPGTVVITGVGRRFCNDIERNTDGTRKYILGRDFSIRRKGDNFIYKEHSKKLSFSPAISVPVWGRNLALSLKAFMAFMEHEGLKVDNGIVVDELSKIRMPGRWDIRELGEKKVLLDVAHNPQAWSRLFSNLKKYWNPDEVVFLVGVLKDKNWRYLFKKLSSLRVYYFEVGPQERRLSFEEVYKSFPFVRRGEDPLKLIRGDNHLLYVVSGSFYMVSRVLCRMKKEGE